jgi:hypothetical protein
MRVRLAFAALAATVIGPAVSGQVTIEIEPMEIARFKAAEARQGVAVEKRHIYVNANSSIGKYDKRTGRKLATWVGDPEQFIHMNSCVAVKTLLTCAASNYPQTPMASSVETFDTRTLKHVSSYSIGPGKGSLTWLDWHKGHWWAMFAHYDGRGGEPGRDHRHSVLVRYDRNFVERGAWMLPPSVLDRMKPYSSSGGSWSADGLLYVTGHDRKETYALDLPRAGSVLKHVATLPLASNGQAIAWDRYADRILWSIDRQPSQVVAAQMPAAIQRPDR